MVPPELLHGWEVILREFSRSDLSPFYSLLESLQHHNLLPEVNLLAAVHHQFTNLPPHHD
jgi:hypothetical protein